MERLLDWFNARTEADSLVQAALAHLWFETIHPFEDGNGRVGRVIVDLVLARDSAGVARSEGASRLIRIATGRLADGVVLVVEDSGIGIPPPALAKLLSRRAISSTGSRRAWRRPWWRFCGL